MNAFRNLLQDKGILRACLRNAYGTGKFGEVIPYAAA